MANKTKVPPTTPQPSEVRLKRWTGPRAALAPASSSSLGPGGEDKVPAILPEPLGHSSQHTVKEGLFAVPRLMPTQ